jgi:transposase
MRWPWRKRKPAVVKHPPIVEHCWECGIDLCKDGEHELRAYGDDTEVLQFTGGVGGTYVSESFCVMHCPGGCLTPHLAL